MHVHHVDECVAPAVACLSLMWLFFCNQLRHRCIYVHIQTSAHALAHECKHPNAGVNKRRAHRAVVVLWSCCGRMAAGSAFIRSTATQGAEWEQTALTVPIDDTCAAPTCAAAAPMIPAAAPTTVAPMIPAAAPTTAAPIIPAVVPPAEQVAAVGRHASTMITLKGSLLACKRAIPLGSTPQAILQCMHVCVLAA